MFFSPWSLLARRLASGVALFLCLLAVPLHALDLHRERFSPYDLALVGELAGVPAGETRFVRWADLRKLPVNKLTLSGEFVSGEQEVTALMLADLWAALPCAPGTDTLLATCTDGYASIYRRDFVSEYRPFIVLEINGQGPEKWPPPRLTFNPGPYVITIAASLAPKVATLLDAGHKRPWGVATLEVATYAGRERAAFTGKWATMSARAVAGRSLWIDSCASCHRGPGDMFGGTKADRPFEVIAAHAGYNQAYFKKYVRDPKSVMPGAKMEPHPHYTDEQLDALAAFITAEPAPVK